MNVWTWSELLIDFGLPVALAGVGYGVVWLGKRSHRAVAARRCPHCGYDMRESMGLVCPECGKFCESQKVVEHGRPRRWLVAVGWVMFVPLVWMAVFTAVAVMLWLWLFVFENRTAEWVAGDYPDAASGRVVRVEAVRGAAAGFWEPMEINPVAAWALWQLRYWMDDRFQAHADVSYSEGLTTENGKTRRFYLDAEVYQDSRIFGLEPQLLMCCSPGPRELVWTRYFVHVWVCPMLHYGEYFRRDVPADTLLVRVMDVQTGRPVELTSSTGGPMPDEQSTVLAKEAVEKIGAVRGLKNVVFIGVACDDRVMGALAGQGELLTFRASHITASEATVSKVLSEMPQLRSLRLQFDRPVTDADVAAIAGFRDVQWPEVTWMGEAHLKDESMAKVMGLRKVTKWWDGGEVREGYIRAAGLVYPGGYTQTLKAFKANKWANGYGFQDLEIVYRGPVKEGLAEDDLQELRKSLARVWTE